MTVLQQNTLYNAIRRMLMEKKDEWEKSGKRIKNGRKNKRIELRDTLSGFFCAYECTKRIKFSGMLGNELFRPLKQFMRNSWRN